MGCISENDDSWLLARVSDAARLCSDRAYPCFVGFLDERQHMLAENALRKNREVHALFWGGHEEAERTLLGVFPSFLEPDPALFPVESLGFSWRGTVRLTHRDFLGTMLGCGIKREKIGDILCGEGMAAAFVHEDVAGFLSEQIVKIGGEGVTVERPFSGVLPAAHAFREIRDTVASPRLDAVLKAVLGTSREEAVRRIAAGLVSLNHVPCMAQAAPVKDGDVLSVRGAGRYIVDALGPPTKKGRLCLKARKYI